MMSYQNALNAHSLNDRFHNIILDSPETRDRWVRRMRTLMDQYPQPPGTVNGFLETRMRATAASIDPDPATTTWTAGDLDFARWGIHSNFIQNRPREEVERLSTTSSKAAPSSSPATAAPDRPCSGGAEPPP